MGNNRTFNILSGLVMIGELGFQVIFPPVALTLLAVWLNSKYDIGVWLPIAALAVGLATGGCAFYRFARIWLTEYAEADTPPAVQGKENPDEN